MSRVMQNTRALAGSAMFMLLVVPAQAETVRSATYEATADRRSVSLKAQSGGGAIAAEQVLIAVRRLDGQPAGSAAQGFAEKVACNGGAPVVSLALGSTAAGASFDILCRTGG